MLAKKKYLAIAKRQFRVIAAHQKKEAEEGRKMKLNRFVLVLKSGKTLNLLDQICYAVFNRSSSWCELVAVIKKDPPVMMVDWVFAGSHNGDTGFKHSPLVKQYVHWLANDSYWRKCFITKNAETIINKGTIYDCKFPSRYVIMSATNVRHAEEFPRFVKTWGVLKEVVDPDVALYLSHFIKILDNGTAVIGYSSEGHFWEQSTYISGAIIKQLFDKKFPADGCSMTGSYSFLRLKDWFKGSDTFPNIYLKTPPKIKIGKVFKPLYPIYTRDYLLPEHVPEWVALVKEIALSNVPVEDIIADTKWRT